MKRGVLYRDEVEARGPFDFHMAKLTWLYHRRQHIFTFTYDEVVHSGYERREQKYPTVLVSDLMPHSPYSITRCIDFVCEFGLLMALAL
jgi:hypothetical protein